MKRPKYFQPEQDFAFAADLFKLSGEVAVQTTPPGKPFQAEPLELFADKSFIQSSRETYRRELL